MSVTRPPVSASETRRPRVRRVLTLFASIVLAVGITGGPTVGAVAQEASGTEPTPLEGEKTAYWTRSSGAAVPDILVEEFPPGVVCIVIPETCGDDARQVTGPIDEALPPPETAPKEPGQPVPPGSLPAGRTGGNQRYVSAAKFALPAVPEGKEISRFTMLLAEDQPTYSMDSPIFRQAVLAALASIQQGEPAQDQFRKMLETQPVDAAVMEVEACPATKPFEAGDNQDWENLPEMDCIFGAQGQRNDDGIWAFDLTFAAQGWTDGEIPNEGVVIAPISANNVAFGDPDSSDNAQVTFAGFDSDTPPMAIIEYGEAFDASAAPPLPPASSDTGSGSFSSGSQSSDVFGTSPSFGTQTGGAPAFEPAPEVAPQPQTAPAPQAAPAVAGAQSPITPWWVWLLVPIGLAGMYLVSRSLTAEPALATERAGAMTRLIEQRSRSSRGARSVLSPQV